MSAWVKATSNACPLRLERRATRGFDEFAAVPPAVTGAMPRARMTRISTIIFRMIPPRRHKVPAVQMDLWYGNHAPKCTELDPRHEIPEEPGSAPDASPRWNTTGGSAVACLTVRARRPDALERTSHRPSRKPDGPAWKSTV